VPARASPWSLPRSRPWPTRPPAPPIQQATQTSATLIRGITETIGKVSETAAAIAAAVQEQGAATQEIASNVLQAARGTQHVSDNITDVGEAAKKTGATATRVHDAPDELSRSGDAPKMQVETVLREVSAA
jgi:methyl-accepting chemotaxis protein